MGSAVGEPGHTAPAASATPRVWRFANAVLDERTLALEIGGSTVELERKPLEVLLHLLRHAGDIVTKDELLAAVWPERILSDTVLAKSIGRLREVLADDDGTIIKTVRGYGYRLVAQVQAEVARVALPAHFDFKPGDHPPHRPLWNLVERLGTGGHGEAWLVRHDKTRERRVFKFALGESSLSALKREITLFRLLRDALGDKARIVTLLDWNLEQPPYFIEAEYAVGGSLIEWCASRGGAGAVPMATRVEIGAQIAEALAALHAVGVLHKDLKPSNVLIDSRPEDPPKVLLGDLGSGGILDATRLEEMGITRMGFTRTIASLNANSGTLLYCAPELLGGHAPTVQADVYALGVLLYQLVVGDLYRPMSQGWEREVEDELLRADIATAAEGDPEHRLVNAAELARRLRTLGERRAKLAEERRAVQETQALQRESERLQARRAARRLAFAAMAIGLATSTWLYLDARAARAQAQEDAERAQAVADFLSRDMFSVVGAKPLRELSVQELLEAASSTLAQRMQDRPETAAQLHAALGHAFWKMERVPDAEKHLDRALRLYEQTQAPGSETVVSTAGQLFLAYGAVGKAAETLPRFEMILAQGRQRLGPQHPEVLKLGLEIARQRFFFGDWQRSATELQDLIGYAKSYPATYGEWIGMALMHQGRTLEKLGEFKASLAALQDAQTRLAALPGEAHALDLATVHMWLGQTLTRLENFDQAEAELAHAEAMFRPWVVGDGSAHLLSVQFYRGKLRLCQNRAAEAVEILEKVVNTTAALDWTRSADHTYEFRAGLARAYEAAGRQDEARAAMRKALEISEHTLGLRHPMSQHIRLGLADLTRKTAGEEGGPGAARKLLALIDRGVIAELGPDHPDLAELRRLEGLLDQVEHKSDQARKALAEAQRIYALRYGPSHALSRRAQQELAAVPAA